MLYEFDGKRRASGERPFFGGMEEAFLEIGRAKSMKGNAWITMFHRTGFSAMELSIDEKEGL